IIGGGACGLMCAVQAGQLGKQTLVLERNDRPGAKIIISGGGRCNYTNLYTTAEQFVSTNPEFAKHAFASWTVADPVDFFEQHGIPGKEKTLGQLFPRDGKAGDVVAVFHRQMQAYGQEMRLNCKAVSVEKGDAGLFTVGYEDGNSGNIDRKSTRLNSSHVKISYAVFCLKKKIEKEKELFDIFNRNDTLTYRDLGDLYKANIFVYINS